MKNKLWVIAIIMAILFCFITCDDDDGGSTKWTAVKDSPFDGSVIETIAYCNNLFFAVGYNHGDGNGKMATSTDGVKWTDSDTGTTFKIGGIYICSITAIAYGNGKFVAGGWDGKIATSTDSVTWTAARTNAFETTLNGSYSQAEIYAIAYGNDKFVAVGSKGRIATSTDGVTWTKRDVSTIFKYAPPYYSNINAIAYGSGKFVAVGYEYREYDGERDVIGKMATSTDGVTWAAVTQSVFGDNDRIYAITFDNGKFVAGGGNGKMATSTDGVTWTAVKNSTFDTNVIKAITYGNKKFIAVGSKGKMATSPDGTKWSAVKDSTFGTSAINSIAYGNGKFVAGISGGKIAYSTGK